MKKQTMKHRTLQILLVASFVLLARGGSAQTIEYYHLDALGSVRGVTDQTGAVIERHDYLPFGDEVNPPGASNPRQFTGKERDTETGMDYFGARYFSGERGRFSTIDPIFTWQDNLTDPQRWNRYAYARNNPVRYVDPDGRAFIPGALLGGAFGAGFGFVGSVMAQRVSSGSFSNIDYRRAAAAAAGGAVSGALAGGTLGLSVFAGASVGAVMGISSATEVVGGAVNRAADGDPNTHVVSSAMVVDAAVGAAGGRVGVAVSRAYGPEIAHLMRTRAGMLPAAREGNYGAATGARGIAGQIDAARQAAEVGATVVGAQFTNQVVPVVTAASTARRDRQ
jgi:RHS repeat-associated protein